MMECQSLPLDCYKNQQICEKTVDNYLHVLKCVPNGYKTQKMCDKAVNTHPSAIQFVPECSNSQEI